MSANSVELIIDVKTLIDAQQGINTTVRDLTKMSNAVKGIAEDMFGAFGSGFEAATGSIRKQLDDVTQSYAKVAGDWLSGSGGWDQTKEGLREMSMAAESSLEKVIMMYNEARDAIINAAQATDSFTNRQAALEAEIEQLEGCIRDLDEMLNQWSTTDPKKFAKYAPQVEELRQRLEALKSQRGEITSQDLLGISENDMQRFLGIVGKIPTALEQSQEAVANYGKAAKAAIAQTSPEYEKEFRIVDKLNSKMASLYKKINTLGRMKSSDQASFMWTNMQTEIENTSKSIEELQAKLRTMIHTKSAFKQGDKSMVTEEMQDKEYARMAEEIDKLRDHLKELVDHYNEVKQAADDAAGAAKNMGEETEDAADKGDKKTQGLSGSIRKFAYTMRAYNYVGRMIAAPFNFAINLAKKLISIVKSGINHIKQFMSRVASGITSILKKAYATIKQIFSKISSGFGGIFGKIHLLNFSFGDFVKTAASGLKKVLRLFMRFGLGARSTYFLIRKLRSAFIEMYKAAAEQIPEINEQVSAIMTGVQQLKGELVTAFQPLAEKAIPILETVLDKMNGMLNALGQFNAALTGQGYIYEFVADEQDYAQSMEDAANKTKKATKEAKEYQKTLMGFDQINRLNDPDKGKSEEEEEELYDPTASAKGKWIKKIITDDDAKELAERIKDFWEKIKQVWKDGADFTFLGQIASSKFEEILDKLNTFIKTKLNDWLTKGANALATFLNGFLTTDLANKIGEILGNLANTVQNMLITFFEKLNWHQLGIFLANSLERAIQTWDAKRFGRMIADFLIAAISTWWSFVSPDEGFDFELLGEKIATAINNFVARMNDIDPHTGLNHWQELGDAITNTIVGLVTTISTTIKNTDWGAIIQAIKDVFDHLDWTSIKDSFKELGSTVWTAIKENILSEIPDNWFELVVDKLIAKMGELSNFAIKLVDKLSEAVGGLTDEDWVKIGQKIMEALESLQLPELATKLAGLAGQILSGLATALTTEDADGVTPAYKIASAIVTILGTVVSELANFAESEEGTALADQIWQGIKDAFNAWKDDDPQGWNFAKKVAKILLLEKFVTSAPAIGGAVAIIATAFKGLKLIPWDKIGTGIALLKDKIVYFIQWVSSYWVAYAEPFLANVISSISTFISNIVTTVSTFFSNAVTSISTFVTTMAENAGLAVGTFVANIATAVAAVGIAIAALVVNWESIKELFKMAWEGLKNFGHNIVEKAKELGRDFVAPFKEIWEILKDFVRRIWETLKLFIDHIFNAKDQTTSLTTDLKNIWSGFWEDLTTHAENAGKGFVNVIIDVVNLLIDAFNGLLKVFDAVAYGLTGLVGDALEFWGDKFGLEGVKNAGKAAQGMQANWQMWSIPHIPKLAQGAVIPPNRQFLAMLGDQSHGTNIEAPLATIEEAVANVMNDNLDAIAVMIASVVKAINNKDMTVAIGDKEIGQAAARYTRKQNLIKGTV